MCELVEMVYTTGTLEQSLTITMIAVAMRTRRKIRHGSIAVTKFDLITHRAKAGKAVGMTEGERHGQSCNMSGRIVGVLVQAQGHRSFPS